MSDSETDRMRMWREEAMDLARSISTQAVYGPVILGPELAKRVSSMLRSRPAMACNACAWGCRKPRPRCGSPSPT